MQLETFFIILAIMFWALLAILVACFIAWVFIFIQYYKWDKEEKYIEKISNRINRGE